MTLYYSLVFSLLVFEMSIFCVLIVPLPFTWRRKLFQFISTSPIVAKAQYGLKITFIGVLILFTDSVNRVYRITEESSGPLDTGSIREAYRTDMQARKFYSQRNLYLCGFTLFLSLVLHRTYTLIAEILAYEEILENMRSSSTTAASPSAASSNSLVEENQDLKEQLDAKRRDIETLKKQAQSLSNEYNAVSDRMNSMQVKSGESSKKK